MDITQVLGYLAALLIGMVLGLIGGGGSILTVPVLVYIFAINPVTATAYSLFVVGISALGGTFRNAQKKLVDFKTGFILSVPAFIGVYVTRKYVIPAIPEQLVAPGDFSFTKDTAIMVFFAVILLLASASMIYDKKDNFDKNRKLQYNYPLLIIQGLIVGLITGIIGAGGGFLIIPVLVIWVKLPMKKAVATSLLIIAVKSLIGFIGDVENLEIDWLFLINFTAVSLIGILLGLYISNFIHANMLKKLFGWFLLIMGILILYNEIQ